MKLSSIIHRFLLSIVIAAPFYNLMNSSAHKIYIISGVLRFLNIILTYLGEKAKRSVMFRPVSIKERVDFLKKTRSERKINNYRAKGYSNEERLRELRKMFDRGLISEDEYMNKKKEILNEL